jgi:hypothetical protein
VHRENLNHSTHGVETTHRGENMKSKRIWCLALPVVALTAVWAAGQSDERFTPPPPSTCTSPGLYCNGGTTSTSPIRQNNVLLSLGLTSTQLSVLTTMLGTGNTNNSHITGVIVSVPAGCSSNCTSGDYLDAGSTYAGNYCPSLNFSGLDTFIGDVWAANTTNRKLTNIVVAPAGYNNNTETSVGVFSQGWANSLTDCSGNALFPITWTKGNYYLPGDYIRDSGGNYWQIKPGTASVNYKATSSNTFTTAYSGTTAKLTLNSTPPSSLLDQYVTVTLATPSSASEYNAVEAQVTAISGKQITYLVGSAPTWSGTVTAGDVTADARCEAGNGTSSPSGPAPGDSSPYTDGSAANACTWTKLTGTNAPPQDAWVSNTYTGATNEAYQLNLNTTGNSCSLSAMTCTVSVASPYIGSNGDLVTVANVTTTGKTEMNCTSCAVQSISSTQVTYADSAVTVSFSGSINSGATLAAQRVFNINSQNGTVSGSPNPVLASGLPTAYEPPMKAWIKYICGQVYAHYKGNTHVGYIRCGLTEGGEADTDGLTSSPGWPFGSQSEFVSYYHDMMNDIGSLASTNSLVCMGNLNSFDLPEGQISISNNCGIGTNGYKVNDVVQLTSAFGNTNCLVIGDIQSDWCWNFNQYYNSTMPNGNYPILELQTSLASTPNDDALGETGGLAYDSTTADCGSYCPWPGLIPVAKAPVSGSSLSVNDGEWYMCDFMIAYDGSYTTNYSDFNCTQSFWSYDSNYLTAFNSFAP